MTRAITVRLVSGCVLVAAGVALHSALLDDHPAVTHEAGDRQGNRALVWGGETVGQTVRPPVPLLDGVELLLSGPRGQELEGTATLHVRRTPSEATDLRSTSVPVKKFRKDLYTRFSFPPLDTKNEQTLYLFLEYPSGTAERALAVRVERPAADREASSWIDYRGGTVHVNHVPAEGDLAFRLLMRGRRPFDTQVASAVVLGGASLLVSALSALVLGRRRSTSSIPRTAALLAVGAVLPVIFFLPLLAHPDFLGIGDWDMNTTLHAAAERALVFEAGFPGWNPYLCGGTPLAAFPEAPVFSPFFATVLLGGPVLGFKINIMLHGVIGFLGMLLWLRRGFRTSWLAAFLGASVFMFSSFVALHLAAGHSRKVALAWIPWVFFFLHRAWSNTGGERAKAIRHAAPAGAALALMLLDGSVYLSLYTGAFVLLVSGFTSASRRTWRPLVAGIATLCIGGLLAGVHLFPALASQRFLHPRLEPTGGSLPVRGFVDIFLDPSQTFSAQKFSPQPQPWFEYGAYVGIAPLALAILGLATAGRRFWPFLAAAAVFLLGSFSPAVQRGIAFLPLFGDLRNPQRMVVMVTLVLGIASALGCDRLARFLLPPRAKSPNAAVRVALGVLVALVIGHLIFVNTETLSAAFVVPPPPGVPLGFASRIRRGAPPIIDAPFRQGWAVLRAVGIEDSFPFTMENTARNQGSINRCSVASTRPSEALRLPPVEQGVEVGREFIDEPYQGEAFMVRGEGTATVAAFKTSEVTVRYAAGTPVTLALNQNYHPGWSVRILGEHGQGFQKRPAIRERDLVAADVGPGAGTAVFSYTPPFLSSGLLASAVGVGAALWLWTRRRADR